MRCPNCGKQSEVKTRPFCSERCRKLDLGRWFSEDYRVPVEEEDLPDSSDESVLSDQDDSYKLI